MSQPFLSSCCAPSLAVAIGIAAAFGPGAASAVGQVPPGWWVSAHYRTSDLPPGVAGGLWLHHPTGAAPSIAITGLSPGLTGSEFPGSIVAGARSVVMPYADGAVLYVGEVVANPFSTLELRRIELIGTAVASETVVGSFMVAGLGLRAISALATTFVGTGPGADPYVLAGLSGAGFGMGMPQLAIYHPTSGFSVLPPLYGMPPGAVTGIAFTNAYPDLCVSVSAGSGTSTIVGVPITYGSASVQAGPVVVIATVPANVNNMDYDPGSGLIWCACDGGVAPIYTVNRASGVVLPVFAAPGPRLGIARESVTGQLAVTGAAPGLPNSIQRATVGGGTALVAAAPASGWGTPADIDVCPNPRFLVSPPGVLPLNWDSPWTPAAAGLANLPASGNLGWGVSVSSLPGVPLAGMFAFSLAAAAPPIPFGTPPTQMLLIDISPPALLGYATATGLGIAPLAVPIPPGMTGLRLWIQGAFAVGVVPGLQLTDAMAVTIL